MPDSRLLVGHYTYEVSEPPDPPNFKYSFGGLFIVIELIRSPELTEK